MQLNKENSQTARGIRLPVAALLIYFFLLFPAIRIVFRQHPWLPEWAPFIYMPAVLLLLLALKKITLDGLGFSPRLAGRHLLIGGLLGGGIVLAVPALDGLITWTGLGEHELFQGSERAAAARGLVPALSPALLLSVLLVPLVQQVFLNGFVIQAMMQRFNPVLAVYGAGLLFTLAEFRLSLGLFLLGICTAFLLRATGTLYAGWLLHAGCALAGALVLHAYPRLITLVGFLY